MNLYEEIKKYHPGNEQEEKDQKNMLSFIENNSDYLDRSNEIAHFSVSVWIVNPERTKVLMIYHNIFNSWSWVGGHADGVEDLTEVGMREVMEETGVTNARLLSKEILSLETLTVDGHIKRGKYVSSHLHLNVTYMAEAPEEDNLQIKPDENSAVRWCTLEEVLTMPSEKWMVENIYQKLVDRTREFAK